MASERKPADAFETALKRELQRAPSVIGADCPEPDVLAAYYDRALTRSERARVDTHLLACMRCQSMIAAIARADVSEPSPQREPARWLFWVTRLVAPAAVVGIVIAIAIRMRTHAQHAPEVIALESPAAALKPQFVQPAPPPQALPEQLAPSVAQLANPPAATTMGKPHHKVGARAKVAIARKEISPKPEELADEESAKAKTPSSLSEYSSSSPAAKSSGVSASAPGPLEVQPAPAIKAGNTIRSESRVVGGTIPSIAGAAPGAPPLQAPTTQMAETRNSIQSASAAGAAAVSGRMEVPSEAPRMMQLSSPDGSVAWQFGAGGAIMRSGNSGPWLAMHSGVTTHLLAASAPSNDVCWVVGKSGTIVRTLDGGAHWQLITPPSLDNFTAVSATDSNNATVIAANGQRYVTHDGGVTWSSP